MDIALTNPGANKGRIQSGLLSNYEEERHNRLLFWFTFLTAFPVPMLFFNFSFYLFPFLAYSYYLKFGYVIKFNSVFQILAIFFGIGAIISTIDSIDFARSVRVLPNYLYWVVVILFLVGHKNHLRMDIIFKAVFWGIVATSAYYFFLQDMGLKSLPFFKRLSQNTFAFISICFAPIATYYFRYRYGVWRGVLFAMVLTVMAFWGGSRSGSVLVFFGSFLVLFVNRVNLRNISTVIFAVVLLSALELSGFLGQIIFTLNPETYDLVYNREETLRRDQSYLLRLAFIEKGMLIYQDNPYTGIGLQNFTNYYQRIEGNFEGAHYVLHKNVFERHSAHNSYILFLAEGGLVMIVPFILLLAFAIYLILIRAYKLRPYQFPILFGVLAMSVHLFFIAAIVNYFAWFLLALMGCIVIPSKRGRSV